MSKENNEPTIPTIPSAFNYNGSTQPSSGTAPTTTPVFTMGTPSNGAYNPFISNGMYNGNLYQQQMMMRNQYYQQRREALNKTLKENFPTKLLIVHCILLFLVSVAAITIQTLEIVTKNSLYYVGSGYWVSVVNFILILLAYVLYKKKTQGWYSIFMISRILGGFIGMVGLTIINLIGISFCSVSNSSSSSCSAYLYQNIIMIVLGILNLISNIVCIVAFQCYLYSKLTNGSIMPMH